MGLFLHEGRRLRAVGLWLLLLLDTKKRAAGSWSTWTGVTCWPRLIKDGYHFSVVRAIYLILQMVPVANSIFFLQRLSWCAGLTRAYEWGHGSTVSLILKVKEKWMAKTMCIIYVDWAQTANSEFCRDVALRGPALGSAEFLCSRHATDIIFLIQEAEAAWCMLGCAQRRGWRWREPGQKTNQAA